ncbi:MAG: hypothetical protein BWY46_01073 [Firmicutes bacterium ADurb.Bin300]|nr:MAG: hypothetical protein BWY46_01073 [Firmicutes bacterium ADurb.Bin300]
MSSVCKKVREDFVLSTSLKGLFIATPCLGQVNSLEFTLYLSSSNLPTNGKRMGD